MKKIFIIIMCLFLLVGCNNNENTNLESNIEEENNKEDILLNPELKWCQVYNPNGFNTVTCIMSNPNDIDIDVSYDLIFYKEGKEVSRLESLSNFNVSNTHNDVVWTNYNVPNPNDVDEVKIENINMVKSLSKSINAKIEYIKTDGNNLYFSINHDEKPILSTTTFLLYNDNNKNEKCDKEELVVTNIDSTTLKDDTISFDSTSYNYTNYEIYYNAYTEK